MFWECLKIRYKSRMFLTLENKNHFMSFFFFSKDHWKWSREILCFSLPALLFLFCYCFVCMWNIKILPVNHRNERKMQNVLSELGKWKKCGEVLKSGTRLHRDTSNRIHETVAENETCHISSIKGQNYTEIQEDP